MPRMRQRKNKKTQPSLKVLIKRKIDRKIKNIKYQYKVIWSEQDGCDEYGFKYWVECINGFSGRSWEIYSRMRNDINIYINHIVNNGIYVKGKKYYTSNKINFKEIFNTIYNKNIYGSY
jgi:hypothetical protein